MREAVFALWIPNVRYRLQILDLDFQQGKSALRNRVLAYTFQRKTYRTAAMPLTLLQQPTSRLGTGPRPGHSFCTLVLTVVPIVSIALYVIPLSMCTFRTPWLVHALATVLAQGSTF